MATTTSSMSELLAPGLRAIFFDKLQARPEEFSQVFNVDNSTRNFEEDLQVSGLSSALLKPQGTAIQFDDPVQGGKVRYTMDTHALGFRVTMEMMMDDLYNIISKMPAKLAISLGNSVESVAWNLINQAFNSATFTGFDALELASSAHIFLKTGNTFSNIQVTPVDLTTSGVKQALILLGNTKDDSEFPSMIAPKWLLVQEEQKHIAQQILGGNNEAFTANRQINVIGTAATGLRVFVSHYLTSTTVWGIIGEQHDMNFFWRLRPVFDNADDFTTKDALFSGVSRFQIGFGDPRGTIWSQGA